jgi:translocation protein SEC63
MYTRGEDSMAMMLLRVIPYAFSRKVADLVPPPLQGQFFPFFVLTVTGLVTLPLTYTLISPNKGDDTLAPRIETSYKPDHQDVVATLRSTQKKQQRRVKRTLVVLGGWALMAGMLYLISVTTRTVPRLWNPYDILGIAEV